MPHLLNKLLKKEFKIKGSIGLPGQKEKLTFGGLVFQIEKGLKREHDEFDIVEAVVRAVGPDLQLRGFLENKADLSLQSLRRILRSHFQEKDPTTLFNLLSNAVQSNCENPHEFLMRLMNLRQKVVFVSKEAESVSI